MVVGYAYDAAIHCPDCTFTYVREMPWADLVWDDKDPQDYQDIHGHLKIDELIEDGIARDGENNELHAVFDSEETDCPDHCDDCHVFIDTSWTGSAVSYATDAFKDYIMGWLEGKERGDLGVLIQWSDNMNAGMFFDEIDERAKLLIDVIAELEEPNV